MRSTMEPTRPLWRPINFVESGEANHHFGEGNQRGVDLPSLLALVAAVAEVVEALANRTQDLPTIHER